MSAGVETLVTIFVLVWLVLVLFKCLTRCVKRNDQRNQAQNEQLRRLREERAAARREEQQRRRDERRANTVQVVQGVSVPTNQAAEAGVSASTSAAVDPSAPPADDDTPRMRMIKSNLFFRELEHADSVRTLSVVLAAANDQYDNSNEEGNVIARTWRAAETSVRRMVEGEGSHECCICLDGYEAGETVCWSKEDECNHIFHKDCITAWLSDNDDCPLCRAKLIHENEEA
mmetsp:Transcript_21727/g.44799  ORF Transcript_21727/g.44799 Transcript_21727/m.44799 type:complete len:230 (-) Transcript_21727:196-885(-)